MSTTFSLERAKNGEPFTYNGNEALFGCLSPCGKRFCIWCRYDKSPDWVCQWFMIDGSDWNELSMTPKKLEVKIWERDGKTTTTTPDDINEDGDLTKFGWTYVKTIEVEI